MKLIGMKISHAQNAGRAPVSKTNNYPGPFGIHFHIITHGPKGVFSFLGFRCFDYFPLRANRGIFSFVDRGCNW